MSAPTAVPANIPNSDVKWETSEQLNFGLDARLFNSRMGVNFDWYRKITKDWLVVAPVLGTSGAAAPYINGGDVENKGFELMLSWNDRVGDFNYGVTLSGAYNQNKITRLDNAEGVITGLQYTRILLVSRASVGKPIDIYGYRLMVSSRISEVDAYVTADGKPLWLVRKMVY